MLVLLKGIIVVDSIGMTKMCNGNCHCINQMSMKIHQTSLFTKHHKHKCNDNFMFQRLKLVSKAWLFKWSKWFFLTWPCTPRLYLNKKIKWELGGVHEIVLANGPICFCFELKLIGRFYALSGSNIPHQLQHIPTSHRLHHLLLLLSMFSK